MNVFTSIRKTSGFSLIEALIVIGIAVLIFAGLFASFEYSLKLIAQSRAKMTALSLATDRVEYLRSLPYNDVGTVAGIPNGAIPQNRTVMLNGITFSERILIEYVDDPADGVGGSDSNGIVSDYKKAKVEYTWNVYGVPQSFHLITTVVPRSIETTAGGGTIRVNVFDANVAPLPGISVRLLNTTTTSTIDVTRTTDASGTAFFTGAPAAANYQIFVSASDYSSDQTRQATTSLPFPSTLPIAVLESDVSTMNFQVDRLSDLTVKVFNNPVVTDVTESFVSGSGITASSSVIATSSALRLVETGGVYELLGSALLSTIAPSTIESWGIVEVDSLVPSNTDARIRFYTSTSTGSLIPDTDLPGNTIGFTESLIDISGLLVASYPELVMGVELSTIDTGVTPEVREIVLSYIESSTELSGIPLSIRGNKVIGADGAAASVYKFDTSTTTNGSGEVIFDNIEWDSYTISLGGGVVVAEACSANPYFLAPNTNAVLNIRTAPSTANNLRVAVRDVSGAPIIDATVDLTLGGTTLTRQTGWCGQAYFGGLSNSTEYEIDVSAPSYTGTTLSSTTVSGVTYQEVILNP